MQLVGDFCTTLSGNKVNLESKPPITGNVTLTYSQLNQSEITYQHNDIERETRARMSDGFLVILYCVFYILMNFFIVSVCVCVYLVLLSTSLLVIFEDVVSDVILRVNEELLGLTLLIPPLHPHHKQQHQHCRTSVTKEE